jgi:hypothetical protein
MSELVTPALAIELPEARARAASVRDQLRNLEAELKLLAADVPEASLTAVGRLKRASVDVRQAIDQLCTDGAMSPF